MAIRVLNSEMMPAFIIFARRFEYKSISFMTRMENKGNLCLPSPGIAKIFCEVSISDSNKILNAVMITSGGILMPIFSEIPPSDTVITEMIREAINYRKHIYCVLGISGDVKSIMDMLKLKSRTIIDYTLLIEKEMPHFRIEKPWFKVKKGKKNDALRLFPLEKAYLKEEVLLESTSLNQPGTLSNLRKTCSRQMVFFGTSGKETIAKVNTNGQGLGFCQIGGVYTKPEFRNRGISTHLLKILFNEIHKTGRRAVLYVKNDNKPALSLYRKLELSVIGEYRAVYL